jgi:predicted dehydrogenase
MIGCGEIGVATARAIAAAARADHVMVMDRDERLARDMGATYGVPWTVDAAELLAHPDVDAVYIAVPHHLHAPLTIQALEAGKHVLVEKPIATTLADADAMIAAARARGRVLAVAFLAQVDERLIEVRRLIERGAIGRVVGTRIVARLDKPESYWSGGYSGRAKADWRVSRSTAGGGILIMNTSHDLNTIRFVTGLEVERVFCEFDTYSTPVEVEDFIALTYRYRGGAIGTLEAGSAVRGRDPGREVGRIYGKRGQVLLGPTPEVYVVDPFEELEAGRWQPLGGKRSEAVEERVALIEEFAGAALDGHAPPVSGEDARSVLEVVVGAYQSGRTHQPVYLPVSEAID